jgi:hypothetical protein
MQRSLKNIGPLSGVLAAMCMALGTWLTERGGRKVRIKIQGVEAEANTREEVEKLLIAKYVQEIHPHIVNRRR